MRIRMCDYCLCSLPAIELSKIIHDDDSTIVLCDDCLNDHKNERNDIYRIINGIENE